MKNKELEFEEQEEGRRELWLFSDSLIKRSMSIVGHNLLGSLLIYGVVLLGLFVLGMFLGMLDILLL